MKFSNSEMLDVKQVASRINVSASMIYSLVSRGLLKCHRIGRCVRFTDEQIKRYLESCEVVNVPSQPRRRLKHLDC